MIEELRLVTDRKFPAKIRFLNRFYGTSFRVGLHNKSTEFERFPEMHDIKESPILTTAIMEGIDVLGTGDKDFLVLDVEMPEIVTMADFLRQY